MLPELLEAPAMIMWSRDGEKTCSDSRNIIFYIGSFTWCCKDFNRAFHIYLCYVDNIYIYTFLIGMQCHLFLMGETAIQSVYHAVGFRDVCLCVHSSSTVAFT